MRTYIYVCICLNLLVNVCLKKEKNENADKSFIQPQKVIEP